MEYQILQPKKDGLPAYYVTIAAAVKIGEANLELMIGTPNGLATLDPDGHVPDSQLGRAWLPVHAYQTGDELPLPGSVSRFIRCISGGVSGEAMPDFNAYPIGGAIDDGAAVWQKLQFATE